MTTRIAFMMVVAAAANLFTEPAFAQNPPNPLQQMLQKMHVPGTAPPQQQQPPDPVGPAPSMRTADSARALFLKGSVTGEDLKQELEAVKTAGADAKSRNALAAMVSSATSESLNQKLKDKFKFSSNMKDAATDMFLSQAVAFSNKALTDFVTAMTGDDNALRNESILLPPQGLTMKLSQQQSLLTMAALIVGERIARKTLEAAQKDFAGLEGEYAALLQRRQKAAALMADVLDKRRQALAAGKEAEARHMEKDLTQWLSPEDLAFIDSFGKEKSLHDFDNDLGMQNLAIKFLQHSDPTAYADYHAQRDGVVGRSRAYVRSMAGVAAFGGFSVLFVQQVIKTAHDKNLTVIMTALPLFGQFLAEAGPLFKLSTSTLYSGIVIEPAKAQLTYRLVQGGQSSDVAAATEVFDSLNRSGENQRLADALFRNETPGFIYRIYLCDRGQAGQMVDQAVPDLSRKQFAESYLSMQNGSGFSFAEALIDETGTPNSKGLAEPLFSKDQRNNAEVVQIGEMQRLTVANYPKWKNPQLTRLVLANSEGSYAQMQLGNTVIRLVPSMATIYAYESYADSCAQTANPSAPGKPADKKKPAQKSKAGAQS
jgi:hypothetical protein